MQKFNRLRKMILILGLVVVMGSGCAIRNMSPAYFSRNYYLIKPSLFCEGPDTDKGVYCLSTSAVSATDARVMVFAEEIRSTLSERMNNSRLVRSTGGTIQVLTAAAAGLLAAFTGGGSVIAITALSGVSAVTPQLSEVFGTKERAALFAQQAAAIRQAQNEYLAARTKGGPTKKPIPDDEFTSDGATLFAKVVKVLDEVEAGLTGILTNAKEFRVEVEKELTADMEELQKKMEELEKATQPSN